MTARTLAEHRRARHAARRDALLSAAMLAGGVGLIFLAMALVHARQRLDAIAPADGGRDRIEGPRWLSPPVTRQQVLIEGRAA